MVLIRQAAPGEEPFWSLPGGVIEDEELVSEGLVREVREETGLTIVDAVRPAFVLQIDNRRPEQLHARRGPGAGYLATVWTFEADRWNGALEPGDPDGFVSEASFVPVLEAAERLESTPWLSLAANYLRGKVAGGSLWFERWHADGRLETVATASIAAVEEAT